MNLKLDCITRYELVCSKKITLTLPHIAIYSLHRTFHAGWQFPIMPKPIIFQYFRFQTV